LIVWQDIIQKGFWALLCSAAGVGLPKSLEIAPEEFHEDSYDSMALVAEEKSPISPELQSLIDEFPDVLSVELSKDPVKLEAMKIELKEGVVLPVSSPPRRQSGAVRKFIEESVQKLLAAGFIVPSKSATTSPVVVVRAANKDWRLCVDYSRVNEISVCNPWVSSDVGGSGFSVSDCFCV
jgi:hypothetical protein